MKRLLDVVLSGLGLIVLSPLLLALAVAVRLVLGSPVLFRQIRPGLRGRPFTLYKFRSLVDDPGGSGTDQDRLTRLGALLRRTSLDELPELWNVLRGDMSLVGPRPLLMEYLPLYTPEQARRHEVRPGITGWAQINGRNAISWEEKFRLDLWYVEHRSVWLDLRILALTLGRVIGGEGISEPGQATATPFRGSARP
jgi:lipopolysaccharide/colanic/teichoic acid biosynthesis glycosyltransferase